MKVNTRGRAYARRRIRAACYDAQPGKWKFSKRKATELLGKDPDWSRCAMYFLGIDEAVEEEGRERYGYPIASRIDGKVHVCRSALRAAASQDDDQDIAAAARGLLDVIDEADGRSQPTGIRRGYSGVSSSLREEASEAGCALWSGSLELRAEGDGDLPDLVGYAAVFDEWSVDMYWGREKIKKGAFARAIRERQDVIACLEHEGGLNVLGRTVADSLELEEDDVGLQVRIKPAATNAGRDTVELVRRGDLRQMSFQFRVRSQEVEYTDEETLRTLLDLDLFDVAIVAMPAYLGTSIEVDSREAPEGEDSAASPEEIAAERSDLEIRLEAFEATNDVELAGVAN